MKMVAERVADVQRRSSGLTVCGVMDEMAKQLTQQAAEWQIALNEALAKLPEGMRNCKILFQECSKGHGWLTADNWVPHGCPTCHYQDLMGVCASHKADADKLSAALTSAEQHYTKEIQQLVERVRFLQQAIALDKKVTQARIDEAVALERRNWQFILESNAEAAGYTWEDFRIFISGKGKHDPVMRVERQKDGTASLLVSSWAIP